VLNINKDRIFDKLDKFMEVYKNAELGGEGMLMERFYN